MPTHTIPRKVWFANSLHKNKEEGREGGVNTKSIEFINDVLSDWYGTALVTVFKTSYGFDVLQLWCGDATRGRGTSGGKEGRSGH